MKKDHTALDVESSSGNVFEDLRLPDAEERLAKAELARIIRGTIRERGWTQKKAASVLGIATSDVSDLMRGKLLRFSQERLERFLNALDLEIRIQVGPRPAGKKHAGVTVELVLAF
jgi:predicted XRE-type DNA-binding protein